MHKQERVSLRNHASDFCMMFYGSARESRDPFPFGVDSHWNRNAVGGLEIPALYQTGISGPRLHKPDRATRAKPTASAALVMHSY